MVRQSFEFEPPPAVIPDDVLHLIREANERIDVFVRSRGLGELSGFVPSDFKLVYRALLALSCENTGAFVEWGSGFGVATLIAAKLGFDARGIEIQPELVVAAESLADDFEIDAEFVCASYVPAAAQDLLDTIDGPDWLEPGGQDGHDLLDLAPKDLDLVYAYPWPGEAWVIETLFSRMTCPSARLLTFNGMEGMRLVGESVRGS